MRRLIITGPAELIPLAQIAAGNWVSCDGNSHDFDCYPQEFDDALETLDQLGLTVEERVADKIFWRCGPAVHCFCGRKLHYSNDEAQTFVTRCCAKLGELVKVTTPDGDFAVPRHFMALHGLKGAEVSSMGFERWVTKATN